MDIEHEVDGPLLNHPDVQVRTTNLEHTVDFDSIDVDSLQDIVSIEVSVAPKSHGATSCVSTACSCVHPEDVFAFTKLIKLMREHSLRNILLTRENTRSRQSHLKSASKTKKRTPNLGPSRNTDDIDSSLLLHPNEITQSTNHNRTSHSSSISHHRLEPILIGLFNHVPHSKLDCVSIDFLSDHLAVATLQSLLRSALHQAFDSSSLYPPSDFSTSHTKEDLPNFPCSNTKHNLLHQVHLNKKNKSNRTSRNHADDLALKAADAVLNSCQSPNKNSPSLGCDQTTYCSNHNNDDYHPNKYLSCNWMSSNFDISPYSNVDVVLNKTTTASTNNRNIIHHKNTTTNVGNNSSTSYQNELPRRTLHIAELHFKSAPVAQQAAEIIARLRTLANFHVSVGTLAMRIAPSVNDRTRFARALRLFEDNIRARPSWVRTPVKILTSAHLADPHSTVPYTSDFIDSSSEPDGIRHVVLVLQDPNAAVRDLGPLVVAPKSSLVGGARGGGVVMQTSKPLPQHLQGLFFCDFDGKSIEKQLNIVCFQAGCYNNKNLILHRGGIAADNYQRQRAAANFVANSNLTPKSTDSFSRANSVTLESSNVLNSDSSPPLRTLNLTSTICEGSSCDVDEESPVPLSSPSCSSDGFTSHVSQSSTTLFRDKQRFLFCASCASHSGLIAPSCFLLATTKQQPSASIHGYQCCYPSENSIGKLGDWTEVSPSPQCPHSCVVGLASCAVLSPPMIKLNGLVSLTIVLETASTAAANVLPEFQTPLLSRLAIVPGPGLGSHLERLTSGAGECREGLVRLLVKFRPLKALAREFFTVERVRPAANLNNSSNSNGNNVNSNNVNQDRYHEDELSGIANNDAGAGLNSSCINNNSNNSIHANNQSSNTNLNNHCGLNMTVVKERVHALSSALSSSSKFKFLSCEASVSGSQALREFALLFSDLPTQMHGGEETRARCAASRLAVQFAPIANSAHNRPGHVSSRTEALRHILVRVFMTSISKSIFDKAMSSTNIQNLKVLRSPCLDKSLACSMIEAARRSSMSPAPSIPRCLSLHSTTAKCEPSPSAFCGTSDFIKDESKQHDLNEIKSCTPQSSPAGGFDCLTHCFFDEVGCIDLYGAVGSSSSILSKQLANLSNGFSSANGRTVSPYQTPTQAAPASPFGGSQSGLGDMPPGFCLGDGLVEREMASKAIYRQRRTDAIRKRGSSQGSQGTPSSASPANHAAGDVAGPDFPLLLPNPAYLMQAQKSLPGFSGSTSNSSSKDDLPKMNHLEDPCVLHVHQNNPPTTNNSSHGKIKPLLFSHTMAQSRPLLSAAAVVPAAVAEDWLQVTPNLRRLLLVSERSLGFPIHAQGPQILERFIKRNSNHPRFNNNYGTKGDSASSNSHAQNLQPSPAPTPIPSANQLHDNCPVSPANSSQHDKAKRRKRTSPLSRIIPDGIMASSPRWSLSASNSIANCADEINPHAVSVSPSHLERSNLPLVSIQSSATPMFVSGSLTSTVCLRMCMLLAPVSHFFKSHGLPVCISQYPAPISSCSLDTSSRVEHLNCEVASPNNGSVNTISNNNNNNNINNNNNTNHSAICSPYNDSSLGLAAMDCLVAANSLIATLKGRGGLKLQLDFKANIAERKRLYRSRCEPPRSLIIFDWDDTILPTTALIQYGDKKRLPKGISRNMARLADAVVRTLESSYLVGDVIIVSNGSTEWLTHTIAYWFPLSLMACMHRLRVRIISAREHSSNKSSNLDFIEPDSEDYTKRLLQACIRWKTRAFADVLGIHTMAHMATMPPIHSVIPSANPVANPVANSRGGFPAARPLKDAVSANNPASDSSLSSVVAFWEEASKIPTILLSVGDAEFERRAVLSLAKSRSKRVLSHRRSLSRQTLTANPRGSHQENITENCIEEQKETSALPDRVQEDTFEDKDKSSIPSAFSKWFAVSHACAVLGSTHQATVSSTAEQQNSLSAGGNSANRSNADHQIFPSPVLPGPHTAHLSTNQRGSAASHAKLWETVSKAASTFPVAPISLRFPSRPSIEDLMGMHLMLSRSLNELIEHAADRFAAHARTLQASLAANERSSSVEVGTYAPLDLCLLPLPSTSMGVRPHNGHDNNNNNHNGNRGKNRWELSGPSIHIK